MPRPKKAPKKPLGRPPLPEGQRRQPIDVTLPQRTIDQARELGGGNVSAGIEIAVDSMRILQNE